MYLANFSANPDILWYLNALDEGVGNIVAIETELKQQRLRTNSYNVNSINNNIFNKI